MLSSTHIALSTPSWTRMKAGGTATARTAIWMASLLAQWALYSTIYYLARASLDVISTLRNEGFGASSFFSAFVGTDAPARAFIPSAATTPLLTLVKKTATGELVPVAFVNGSTVSLFSAALNLPSATDTQSLSNPALKSARVLDALLGSLLTCVIGFAIPAIVGSLRTAVGALEKKAIGDLEKESTLISPDPTASVAGVKLELDSLGSSELFDAPEEVEVGLEAQDVLSEPSPSSGTVHTGDDLATSSTASSVEILIKNEPTTLTFKPEAGEQKIESTASTVTDSSPLRRKPSLNPTAPVFTPKAAVPSPLVIPDLISDSPMRTPSSISPLSFGPPTPGSGPLGMPRAIPTHVTRRPMLPPSSPLAIQRFAPNPVVAAPGAGSVPGPFQLFKRPDGKVFAPVVRGKDGIVRVMGIPSRGPIERDMFF